MSIRQFLTDFQSGVDSYAGDNSQSDAQRRRWLKSALQKLNDKISAGNQLVTVQITAGSQQVILPRDFRFADQMALLAVEYGFSASYAQGLGFTTDDGLFDFGSQINASLNPPHSNKRVAMPTPRVQSTTIDGIARKVLLLHAIPGSDRTEFLIYDGRYQVDDPRVELTIKTNPSDGDTIEIDTRPHQFVASNASADDGQIQLGSTKQFTAKNIAKAISNDSDDSSITARADGAIVSLYGVDDDVDISVVCDESRIIATYYDAINNLTPDIERRVYQLMEASYYLFQSTDTSVTLERHERELMERKAANLESSALDDIFPQV